MYEGASFNNALRRAEWFGRQGVAVRHTDAQALDYGRRYPVHHWESDEQVPGGGGAIELVRLQWLAHGTDSAFQHLLVTSIWDGDLAMLYRTTFG
jgi:hypothetical protein